MEFLAIVLNALKPARTPVWVVFTALNTIAIVDKRRMVVKCGALRITAMGLANIKTTIAKIVLEIRVIMLQIFSICFADC